MEDRWGHDGFKEMEESKDERKHHRSYDRSPRRESRSRSYRSDSRSPRRHSHRSDSRSPRRHSRRSSSRSPHGRHESSHKKRRHYSRSPDSGEDSRENGEKKDYKKQRQNYHEKADTNEIKESERYDPRYSPVSPVNTTETKYGPDRSDFKEYQDDVARPAPPPPQKYGPYPPAPASAPPPLPVVHSQSNSYYQPNDDYEDQVEGRYGLESANEAPSMQPSTTPKIDFSQYDDIPIEISGRDCPRGIEKFSDVDLGRVVLENIKTIGYDRPTPVQKNSIPIVLGGRDLMACAQTGSGKTAAFLLPIISKLIHTGPGSVIQRKCFPLALVLAPTRELACQIQDECKKFAFKTGLKSTVVYGGSPIGYQLKALDYGCDILVATPGRLVDILERGKISLSRIHFLVLDEADRMLDMGFEPQIRKIVEQQDMTPRGQRRTLMFSATFPKEIQLLASQFLEDYIFLAVGRVGSTTELVTQRFVKCEDAEKQDRLLELVQQSHGLTLIFVETKKQADMLGKFLARKGYPATSIHGDRAQKDRTTAIRTFSSGQTPFLVATNVAARGLDIENIAHVINYDMPGDIDDYVHRIGRTGRAGKAGISTSLITPANANLVPKLLELLEEADQQIPGWLGDMRYDRIHKKSRANGFGRGKFGGTDFRKEGGRFNPNMQRNGPPPNRYAGNGSVSQNFPPPPPRDNNMGPYPSAASRMPTTASSSSSGAPPFPPSNGNGYRQTQGPFPPPPPSQKPYSNGYPPPNYPPYNHPPPPPPYGPVPPNSNRGTYPYKPY